MRQIILDTETTGINPKDGHRIIEIGGVEMIDRKLTGKHFHEYINPEREVEAEALAVHGISNEFLQDKPVFKDIAQRFLEFVQGAELVIHNAPFDVGFIDHEFKLTRMHLGKITDSCSILDTLVLARKMHPGQRNNLDALCKRYGIDNSNRDLHGALLDAEILAHVYLAMTGGQVNLFGEPAPGESKAADQMRAQVERKVREPLPVIMASGDELAAHEKFLEDLLH